ncbi:regulatory protein RecX [Steroidobacter sp.]|uniref:regulatory protein RecX n=1 Tax=Steroidobacter sp. TaxID=1978227 RepID=UPI001A58E40A|nr:regulatory protein RecX [Steroidobacter sp.]MBL8269904.1 regulatory protein RecX [Steroidobacter sp.]
MFEAASFPAADDETLTPEQLAEKAKQQDKEVEVAAVRLLSRREHSTEELKRKLAARGYPEASIAAVLDKLGKKNWVSDERFAANYVHHHARRGQGPMRIRAELRQQGITDSQIQQKISGGEQDWNGRAAEVRRRKFGAELPRTAAERAKQARFLQYRGFNSDQIRAALKFDPDADDPEVDDRAGDLEPDKDLGPG